MNTGTDLKINIHIEPISGLTMDDIDFTVLFFTYSMVKSISIKKESMKRIDENNYLAVVCTDKIGPGKLHLKITALIPDNDVTMHEGIRKEVLQLNTDIVIDK